MMFIVVGVILDLTLLLVVVMVVVVVVSVTLATIVVLVINQIHQAKPRLGQNWSTN